MTNKEDREIKGCPSQSMATQSHSNDPSRLSRSRSQVAARKKRYQLHNAATKGDLKLVNKLLKCSADVNAKDKHQRTPLHYAASHNWVECVRLLLNARCSQTLRDKKNEQFTVFKNNQLSF